MKLRSKQLLILASCTLLPITTAAQAKIPKGPYFGQKPPSMAPEVFAPGIISLPDRDEVHCVFSPDGNECFITVLQSLFRAKILYTRQKDGRWLRQISHSSLNMDRYNSAPVFSADGNTIFFISSKWRRSPKDFDTDIWVIERTGRRWSRPRHLGPAINTKWHEWSPAVSGNGTLYFSSYRAGGLGSLDLYRSIPRDGRYQTVENLGPNINDPRYQGSCAIARDESFIVFACSDPWPNEGPADLFVSFRKDGSWTKKVSLGPTINSKASDGCPAISPDGKYLFFNSDRSGNSDIYWIDIKVLDQFRPENTKD